MKESKTSGNPQNRILLLLNEQQTMLIIEENFSNVTQEIEKLQFPNVGNFRNHISIKI